jgi:hypothetical protein
MTVPTKYSQRYLPTKYFLVSYRALSDGQRAIKLLEDHLSSESFFLSDWKIHWFAATTLLRSAIDLFREDSRSCLPEAFKQGFRDEFSSIKADGGSHSIFWQFLRKERDAIIHSYQWQAYEAWIAQDGAEIEVRHSILVGRPENVQSVLPMKSGQFRGRNSVELLHEAAAWVESRIVSALARGGYTPDEERNVVSFLPRPKGPSTLLGFPLDA